MRNSFDNPIEGAAGVQSACVGVESQADIAIQAAAFAAQLGIIADEGLLGVQAFVALPFDGATDFGSSVTRADWLPAVGVEALPTAQQVGGVVRHIAEA